MADASWDQTANLMAMMANCQRAKKTDPVYTPKQFHPFHQRDNDEPDVKLSSKETQEMFGKNFGIKMPEHIRLALEAKAGKGVTYG